MLWVRSICTELDTYLTNVNIFLIKKHVRSNHCRSKSCKDLWIFGRDIMPKVMPEVMPKVMPSVFPKYCPK